MESKFERITVDPERCRSRRSPRSRRRPQTASDDEIIAHAISTDRIVISHDTDFGTLLAYRDPAVGRPALFSTSVWRVGDGRAALQRSFGHEKIRLGVTSTRPRARHVSVVVTL